MVARLPSVFQYINFLQDGGKANQLLLWQQTRKEGKLKDYEAADTQQYRLGIDAKSARREIFED